MRPSLRRRLALFAAALAGGALLGFGLLSYWLIREAKLSRLDARLEQQLLLAGRPRSPNHWQDYAAQLPQALGLATDTAIALRVLGSQHRVLYQSDPWPPELLILPPSRPAPVPTPGFGPPAGSRPRRFQGPRPVPSLRSQRLAGETWRLATLELPQAHVAIAVSLTALDQELQAIRRIYAFAIPGLLLAIAGGAWGLAGQALRPVQGLTQTIQGVTAAGLDQRVVGAGVDVEFQELIAVFNAMLARLERSFQQARRFSGDAAHELRTPLAILQGQLERLLQEVEPGSTLQQRLAQLLEEVSRLNSIVRKLLLLSLADAGQMTVQRRELNGSALIAELMADFDLLAPALTLTTAIEPGLWLRGDRELLTQALQNLLSNAIKYNLPGGWVRVQAQRVPGQALIRISNASLDLPEGDRDRLFDRFQRGDPARTRRIEGTGLGLSLAREVARAHGGDLCLEPARPGETTFRLTLPLGLPPPGPDVSN